MIAVAAFALAIWNAKAKGIVMEEGVDFHGLQASGWHCMQGEFIPDVCSARITFTNTGTEAIGNIHYRTYYVTETGIVHDNSLVDAVIEKLIQPGQTRTIELEKLVAPTDCVGVGILIKSCEVLPQFTAAAKGKSNGKSAGNSEVAEAEAGLQKVWNALSAKTKAALRADERAWIKEKDAITDSAAKVDAIQRRLSYLVDVGARGGELQIRQSN